MYLRQTQLEILFENAVALGCTVFEIFWIYVTKKLNFERKC